MRARQPLTRHKGYYMTAQGYKISLSSQPLFRSPLPFPQGWLLNGGSTVFHTLIPWRALWFDLSQAPRKSQFWLMVSLKNFDTLPPHNIWGKYQYSRGPTMSDISLLEKEINEWQYSSFLRIQTSSFTSIFVILFFHAAHTLKYF